MERKSDNPEQNQAIEPGPTQSDNALAPEAVDEILANAELTRLDAEEQEEREEGEEEAQSGQGDESVMQPPPAEPLLLAQADTGNTGGDAPNQSDPSPNGDSGDDADYDWGSESLAWLIPSLAVQGGILLATGDDNNGGDSQPSNTGPNAADDSGGGFATDEDTAFTTGNVLANDTDPDTGDTLAVQSIDTTGTQGTVTDNGDGTFDYDPNGQFESLAVGESATDTFTYTVSDGNGGTDSATVTLTIDGVNDAPTAVADAFTTDEDTAFTTGNVLTNDSDPDSSDTLSVQSIDTTGTQGTVTDNGDGTFNYDPNGAFENLAVGESATDSFTYSVSDGNGGTDTATVTLTINGVNDAPVATADTFSTDEDTALTVNAANGVLANDSDVENDALTAVLDTDVANGTLTLNTDGSFTYTPDADFNGTDSFTYHANDGTADSAPVTVTLNVGGVNDAPVAADDSGAGFATDEDTAFTTGNVLANDSDPDTSDTLTVQSIDTTGTQGTVTDNGDGTFDYDPNGQFENLAVGESATDTFTYTVSDGNGGTDTATVTLTINGVNDAPTAVADAFTTDEDTSFTTGNVLANDSDPDTGDTLAVQSIDTTGTQGTVTDNGDGTFDYDPNGQFESLAVGESATDTFTYTVSDGNGGTDTATVTITIDGVNDAPTAVADVFTTDEDTAFTTGNVLTNDSDPDGSDTLTVQSIDTTGTQGTVTDNGDGTFDYDPNGQFESLAVGESATDTFTYTVSDGNGGTDTATVTLTIDGVNDTPTAVADAFTTDEDTAFTTGNVLTNDSDPDGSDTLTVQSIDTTGTQGTVTDNGDGTFDYDPNGQFENLAVGESATDTFTYTVSDGNGGTDTATVTVTINGVNDAPTAVADAFTTDEDTSFTTGNVLANDSDPDTSDTLTVQGIDTTGTQGTVTDNGDGTFDYDPNGQFENLAVGESATDTFTYTVSDGNGGTDTATVTLTINGVNDAPVAAPDSYATEEDTTLTVTAANGVLDNDNDVDGDPLTAVLDTDVTDGTLNFDADGSFSYTPDADFNGEDSFTYHANDGSTDSAPVTVTLNVGGANDAPTAVADAFATDEDTAFTTGNVLANDTDPDTGDTLAVQSIDTTGTQGTVTDNGDGTFDYDPNGQFESLAVGESATDTFTYTVSDGNGGTDTATVTITIDGVNDAPTAVADVFTTDEDTAFTTGNVLTNDSDPDGSDTLTVQSIDTTGTQGTVTDNGDGTFDYDPNGQFENLAVGESATDTFTYTVSDGNGGTDTATVTLTIDGVNDTPTAVADAFATDEDTAFTTGNVLTNDSDPDTSDTLTVQSIDTTGTQGAVTNNGDGTFDYDPNGQFENLAVGESATDTFTYTVSDGNGGTDTASVTLTINGVNDTPTAVADAFITDEDTAFTTGNVLTNDSDPDGSDTLTVQSIDTTGTQGLVTDNGDGTFDYDPNGQFESLAVGESATDTFTYTVSDGNGGTDTATVTLTIDGVNDTPTAVADAFATDEDTAFTTGNVLTNDSDPDTSDTLTVQSIDTTGTQGTVTDNGDGTFDYDPNGQFESLAVGESATDTFTYTVSDGNGGTDTATVTITIDGVNDAPTAVADVFTTDEDTAFTTGNVLTNDSDPDGSDTLTVQSIDTTGTQGTVTDNGDGTFDYDPNGQFESLAVGESATDTFTYTVSDGNGGTDTATVTLTINGANDAPVGADDSNSADEAGASAAGTDATGNVLANDTDVDNVAADLNVSAIRTGAESGSGTAGTVGMALAGSFGSLTVDADGGYTYEIDQDNPTVDALDDGDTLTDTFTYTVSDGDGGSDTAALTLTINGADDAIAVIDLGDLDGNNGFRLDGEAEKDVSGTSVSSAGDVNGDGFDDLIVGAYRADHNGDSNVGSSYVVFGQAGGFDPAINLSTLDGGSGFRLDGEAEFDGSGRSVSGAGDVNGDGFDDLIVGAAGADPGGSSYVVFGQAGGFAPTMDLSSLDGNSGFRLDGDVGDRSGVSVSTAGDVNGDGFDDLIVGAYGADPNDSNTGSSFVIFGQAGGFAPTIDLSSLDGATGFRLNGEAAEDQSGRSVSGAGDINGDGFDDLIVGAYYADPNGGSSGSSYVVFGQAGGFAPTMDLSTLDGDTGFRLDGEAESDKSGYSVSTAGDVNGDGFDDLIVGATYADPNGDDTGSSYVVFGRAGGFAPTINLSTLDGTTGFRLDGEAEGDRSGRSVSTAGDVNGDGFDDLIVGADRADPNDRNSGSSYVVFGQAGGFDATLDLSTLNGGTGFRLDGEAELDYSGGSVSTAGDVNGDGFDDLIVGADRADPNGDDSGSSYVVFGFATTGGGIDVVGDSADNNITLGAGESGANGGAGNDTLTGNADANTLVGGQGDDTLDGAGGDDVLLGGQGDDTLIFDAADTLRVDGGTGRDTLSLSGSTNTTLDLTALNDFAGNGPNAPYENIEIVDLAGGANTLTLGAADLFRLTDAATGTDTNRDTNLLRVDGAAGDAVNSAEVWINLGAADADGTLTGGGSFTLYESGEARLLVDNTVDQSGITSPVSVIDLADLDGNNGFRLDGEAESDNSGFSVSTAGDVNGDGFDDLIIGALYADPNGSGSSYVVFGQAGGFDPAINLSSLDGTTGFRLDGEAAFDFSGRSVSGAGDVNGDGFDDLIIGADGADPNGNVSGSSYVIFGHSGGFAPTMDLSSLDGNSGFRLDGESSGDRSGVSVSGAGDVNGDGFDDLIVGAYSAGSNGNSDTGSSFVIFGQAGGFAPTLDLSSLDGNTGFRLNGADGGDEIGISVSTAGDVNGDGFDDLIVGAYFADSSYVIFGQAGGFAATINLSTLDGDTGFRLDGESSGDLSGRSVSTAGDVNGDGFDDLIVGAYRADPNGQSSGSSYVVFGREGGFDPTVDLSSLDGTTGFRLDGAAVSDRSGRSVSTAGDVNGDGFDDLIVGADRADPNGTSSGSSYVVFGQAGGFDPTINLSTLNGGTGFRLDGEAGDRSGRSVSTAGDVNGDGFDDLIVGAYRADPNGDDSGSSYVVFGFATTGGGIDVVGDSADNNITLGAGESGANGGAGNDSLTGNGGDNTLIGGQGDDSLDGAGGDDVLVGGQGDDTLIFDAADTLRVDGGTGRDTLSLSGSTNTTLDLTALNDFAGNGPNAPYENIEIVDLAGGANTLTLGAADLFRLTDAATGGDAARDNNLLRVDGAAGDAVNSAEVWINLGAADADGTLTGGGSFTLYQSGEARLLVDNTVDQSGITSPVSVIDLADLDGNNGFRLDGEAEKDVSGTSVSSAGDVNGDGFDDLIVGAYRADHNGDSNVGSSYVVFGQAGGFDPAINLSTLDGGSGFRLDGEAEFDGSGRSVSGAGDVNGDGFDDLIIGADGADPNGKSSGSSYVVFGQAGGFAATMDLSSLDGSTGFRLDGESAYDYSGRSVSTAGDVNGDGFDDLIVGAYSAGSNGTSDTGSSFVIFGQAGGFAPTLDLSSLDGTTGFRLDGEDSGDQSGSSVSGAGDVNGDGFDDLIIGAHRVDPNGSFSGSSYVVFGQAGGFAATLNLSTLDGDTGFRLDGEAEDDRSGVSVSTAGDVNGDGFDDLIVGATYADPNGDDTGSSYVVFGRAGGFAPTIDLSSLDGTTGFRLDGAAEDDRSGVSVSTAGDVNGDGFDDLIVGADRADPNDRNSGSSYVVFGQAGGFDATLDLSTLNGGTGFRLDGEAELDYSGGSVSTAGDVNGDGFDDLLVGANRADPNGDDSGSSYVVFGFATTGGGIDVVGDSADNTITLGAGESGANGGAGDDSLTGNAGDNTLVGGQGDDTLDGAGGDDVLLGGQGDDTLIFDAANTLRVDGGTGRDTLSLSGSSNTTLDLTALNDFAGNGPNAPYENIEIVDLAGGANTLTLGAADLFRLTDAATGGDAARDQNLLRVDGGANDAVTTSGSDEWTNQGAADADGNLTGGGAYTLYENGEARLLVDNTVDQSGITSPVSVIDLSDLDGNNGFRLDGEATGDSSGRSVSGAGDVNGDGFDDLIVGAYGADPNGSFSGSSYVIFGQAGGFDPTINLSTLDGGSGFRLDGEAAGDYSSRSVSGAGDVNGDGFDDLIVGAYGADPNGSLSGSSYVVFGQAGGFDATINLSTLNGGTGFRLDGEAEFDISGHSVSGAGDVNGDGFDDLIVGAYGADPNGSLSGSSYVIFGQAVGFAPTMNLSSLDGNSGFRLDGVAADDRSGVLVSTAGDVNGDGFDDLIIGANRADRYGYSGSESSYVVFGQAGGFAPTIDLSTLDGDTGFRLDGEAASDRIGISASTAGDVNGDGFDDLIVGAYRATTPNGTYSGSSYVVFGQAGGFDPTLDLSGLDGQTGFRLDGAAERDYSGYSVSTAGDVNGDGFDDLIVGAYYADPNGTSSGSSYVVFGQAGGFDATLDLSTLNGGTGFRLDGEAGDRSGRSVSGAGDVNGDGFDDLIIGANSADPNGNNSGSSYVVFGFATTGGGIDVVGDSADNNITLGAGESGANGGAGNDTLTGNAGDNTLIGGQGNDTLDGAGGDDVLLGGQGDDTLIFDAADTLRVDGGTGRDTLSLSGSTNTTLDLTALNDFAGNGPNAPYENIEIVDLAGGANTLTLGAADLFRLTDAATGGDAARDQNLLRVDGATGDAVTTSSGSWANLGVADGDGSLTGGGAYTLYQDGEARLLVDNNVNQSGIETPLVIDLADLDGNNGFRLDGAAGGDQSGVSVSTAGDVNGDGFDDLIIGANRADPNGNNSSGSSYVVFGQAGGFAASMDLSSLDGQTGFRLDGAAGGDQSGFSVSTAGDVNGDGFDDLIVGAFGADPNGNSGSGSSYVVFGQVGGFDATLDLSTLNGGTGFRLDGVAAGDFSGRSVSTAGDVNGDGFDDLIVGAYSAGSNGNNSGSSYVVFGQAGGFAATIDLSSLDGTTGFRLDGEAEDDLSGKSVSTVGDVNGDGFDDLIVGATDADPNGNNASGSSYVVFGQAGGFDPAINLSTLDGGTGFRLDGAATGDRSGRSVSGAGDVNADGFDDLIVGADLADPNGNSGSGSSYVVFGQAGGFAASMDLSSLDGQTGFRLDGAAGGDQSGFSVSTAGDVNGDGFDDLIVGAFGADPNGNIVSGSSYVVFGQAGGFDPTINLSTLNGGTGFRLDGVAAGDFSARSVSTAGDINGDGFDDLIVGAFGTDPNGDDSGSSYVVFGFATTTGGGIDVVGDSADNNITLGAGESGANGGAGNDTLTGNADDNTLIGGQGDDSLDGAGGDDVLLGGQGDDTLIFDAADTLRVDGGTGRDTLSLSGSTNTTLDLTALNDFAGNGPNAPYENIEIVDLAGGANTLTLGQVDLFNLVGSATGTDTNRDTNLLRVDGGVNDAVTTSGTDEWTNQGAADADGTLTGGGSYTLYRNGEARLLIDNDVNQSGINLPPTGPDSVDVSSLDGSNGFTLLGVNNGDRSGTSVVNVGDVNGDGFDDLLIGAPQADGPGDARSGAGDSYLVFGGAGVGGAGSLELSSLSGGNGLVFYGQESGENSGYSVSAAGDINGDGFADLLIGAKFANIYGSDEGRAYVVYGSDTLENNSSFDLNALDGSNGVAINGYDSNDQTGFAVSSAGDVNGDGLDDILISAYTSDGLDNATTDAGDTYLVFGNTNPGNGSNPLTFFSPAGFSVKFSGIDESDFSGFAISAAGDIDGDGLDDLIIGTLFGDGASADSDRGESYIVYGSTVSTGITNFDLADLDGGNGFVVNGIDDGDQSGVSVRQLGDVNGDGFDDVIISSYRGDSVGNSRVDAGEAHVLFGGAGVGSGGAFDLSSLDGGNGFTLNGETAGDQAAYSVSHAGDINGDGFFDLLIGATQNDAANSNAGATYVVYGGPDVGNGGSIDLGALDGGNGFVVRGLDTNDYSGFVVGAAGDINGDGFDDLTIGVPRADSTGNARPDAGETYVLFGADFRTEISSAQLGDGNANSITGTAASESLNGAGGDDVLDGAGGNDVLIGGSGDDVLVFDAADTLRVDGGNGRDTLDLSAESGRSLDLGILNGFATQTPTSPYASIEIIDLGNNGNSLSLNSADLLDLAEAFTEGSTTENNLLRIDGGATAAVSTSGSEGWSDLGSADANGDTGGSGYTLYQRGEAGLLVRDGINQSGVTVAVPTTSFEIATAANGSITIQGIDAYDNAGLSVSSAGDVNGDGFDDVLIAAYRADPGGRDRAGESYIVYGSASPATVVDLASLGSAGVQINGIDDGDALGRGVAAAGDVNGDGFDDVILGADLADQGGDQNVGESYIVFGGTSLPNTIELNTLGNAGVLLVGIDAEDLSGRNVSGAGDINGDGFDDVLISAERGADNGVFSGESYLVFGGDSLAGTTVDLGAMGNDGFTVVGASERLFVGSALSVAGDINGDGFDDLLIAAPFATPGDDEDAGQVYAIFGGDSLGGGTIQTDAIGAGGFTMSGVGEFARTGVSVSGAGDINGDGFEDMVIGANNSFSYLGVEGRTYVVFGGDTLAGTNIDLANLGNAGFILNGSDFQDRFGTSVSDAGDVNGDGFGDILVSATGADVGGNDNVGENYVIFGSDDLAGAELDLANLGSRGFVINGANAYDAIGDTVSSAGDVNGDGFDDLMTGAFRADPGGETNAGEGYVIFGGDFFNEINAANIGTNGNDNLTGTAADESFIGGQGNDTLDGAGGNDVLIGGEGDDTLLFDAADTLRVDGGNGFDSLRLTGGADLDLTAISNGLLTNIEEIDMETDAGANDLIMNTLDALALSDESNDIFVQGDSNDALTLAGGEFTANGTQMVGGETFDVFTAANTDAMVFVDQDVAVTI